MKKVSFITCFFIFFLSFFVKYSSGMQQGDEPALVFFYRLPNYVGSGIKMKILANNEPVIMLKNGSYYQHSFSPGEYNFSCKMGPESSLKISLEPGKTYYIKGYINTGFWSAIPILELVDSLAGQAVIESKSLRPLIYETISTERYKSRLGLTMGGGAGFEKMALFIDEDGKDVNLSTGGGVAIGAEAGREISRHFDLSFNVFYQSGTLSRSLKNASASFGRMGFNLTPAFIIPVKGGDYYRFRLGGGPGLYSLGTMNINALKAGGDKYKYKYNAQFGLHASFLFDSDFSEHGSFYFGLKYYSVNYEYIPSQSSHINPGIEISNPRGSGLDFSMGFFYRF